MEKNSAEIANLIATAEQEYSKALDDLQAVEETILLLQREIIGKQGRKKDLEIEASKARYIVRKLKITISLLTKQFWGVKNQGL